MATAIFQLNSYTNPESISQLLNLSEMSLIKELLSITQVVNLR